MAELATIAAVATIGAAVVGTGATVYSAYQQVQQGEAIQKEAVRQAQVDEASGKQEYAASQREAELRRLEGRLIMSRQQAFAAASGGGADDPTILKIMSDTGANAELGAQSVMYQGAARQQDYLNAAQARRISGRNNYMGAVLSSVGTLASGIGRLADTSSSWGPAIGRLAGVA